jgi:hypothetical protein
MPTACGAAIVRGNNMQHALLLDDDAKFLLAAQKLLPSGTEWLATADLSRAQELISTRCFDVIIVRRKNKKIIENLLAEHFAQLDKETVPLKSIVVLSRISWKWDLKKILLYKVV